MAAKRLRVLLDDDDAVADIAAKDAWSAAPYAAVVDRLSAEAREAGGQPVDDDAVAAFVDLRDLLEEFELWKDVYSRIRAKTDFHGKSGVDPDVLEAMAKYVQKLRRDLFKKDRAAVTDRLVDFLSELGGAIDDAKAAVEDA